MVKVFIKFIVASIITIILSLTSLADDPETSIHVFEKNAQDPNINAM